MRYLRQGKDRGYTGKWVVTMQAIDDVYESGFEDGTFDDFTAALVATISESHAYSAFVACTSTLPDLSAKLPAETLRKTRRERKGGVGCGV